MLSYLERKESIILTTIDVMNEYGIHSVSTREIANREGITEAAIFKHFPRKSDLFIAVLDYFSRYDNDIFQSIKLKKLSPLEAIKYFSEMYASYFHNYPALTVIIHSMDEMRYNKDLSEKVSDIIYARRGCIKEYVTAAQKENYISNKYDADIITSIFMGTFSEMSLNWRMNNYSFSLKEKCNKAIDTLIDAFKIN